MFHLESANVTIASMTRRGVRPKDLTGNTFGILYCLEYAGKTKYGAEQYLCECKCGIRKTVTHSALIKGQKSCGCLARENARITHTTHGLTQDPLFTVWKLIKERCSNPKHKSYKYYGGKGIVLYGEWVKDFKKFYSYITEELGQKPSKRHTLDRKDSTKNYEPGNLRWALPTLQAFNKGHKPNKYARGVKLFKRNGKFVARISKNNKRHYLGYFDTVEEANAAYNKAALELFGIKL